MPAIVPMSNRPNKAKQRVSKTRRGYRSLIGVDSAFNHHHGLSRISWGVGHLDLQGGMLVLMSRGFGFNTTSPGSPGGFATWISTLAHSFRRAEASASTLPLQDLLGGLSRGSPCRRARFDEQRLRPQHNLSRISWGVCHVWISALACSFRQAEALASIQPLQDLLGSLSRGSPC